MHPDHDRPGEVTPAIVGELARIVDTYSGQPVAPVVERDAPLAVETLDRDPDLDAEIMEGVRARRAPLLAIAATGAAGLLGWVVTLPADPSQRGTVALGAGAAAVLALLVARARYRHGIPDGWHRRWWLSGVLAVGWVVHSARGAWPQLDERLPPWLLALAVLVLGGALLSAKWWAEWEVPHPCEVVEPEPDWEPEPLPAIEPSRAAVVEQAWAQRVSDGKNPVAKGALLTGRTELPNGATQWMVELDPEGSVSTTDLLSKSVPIARALRMKASNVIVERLPGDGDREDRALLTVVTRDLLSGGVPYLGPRYRDGRIPVGLYADGQGEADYIAADNGGARSGLVTGDSGSGKTALLEAIVMGKKKSGVWRALYADGDPEGGSSPTNNVIVDWPEAGPEGALRQLRAVEALVRVRSRVKGALTDQDGPLRRMTPHEATYLREARIMHPCREWPGYVWVIDELHRLITDLGPAQAKDFVRRLERILRIGRKYGVVVLVGTQSLGGGDFGGSTMLRAQLASRNAFVMRSTNRSDQYSLNGINVNPGLLKEGAGYAFAVGRGRLAAMRVAWSEDMADYATDLPDCPGDEESALAVELYRPKGAGGADEALEARLGDLDAWVVAAREGRNLDDEADDEQVEAATQKPPVPASVGGVGVPQPLGGKVIPIRPARAQPARPVPVKPLSALGPLPASASRVLEVLRSNGHPVKSGDMVTETGLSRSDVSRAYRLLSERGLARWEHGAAESVQVDAG